jgi:hypothetical protein
MNKNAFSQLVYLCNMEAYPKICINIQESLACVVSHYREVAVSSREHQGVGPNAV